MSLRWMSSSLHRCCSTSNMAEATGARKGRGEKPAQRLLLTARASSACWPRLTLLLHAGFPPPRLSITVFDRQVSVQTMGVCRSEKTTRSGRLVAKAREGQSEVPRRLARAHKITPAIAWSRRASSFSSAWTSFSFATFSMNSSRRASSAQRRFRSSASRAHANGQTVLTAQPACARATHRLRWQGRTRPAQTPPAQTQPAQGAGEPSLPRARPCPAESPGIRRRAWA